MMYNEHHCRNRQYAGQTSLENFLYPAHAGALTGFPTASAPINAKARPPHGEPRFSAMLKT
jgi:hypothetical protein